MTTDSAIRSYRLYVLAALALLVGELGGTLEVFLFCAVIALLLALMGTQKTSWRARELKSVWTNLAILACNRLVASLVSVAFIYYGQWTVQKINLPHISREVWDGVPIVLVAGLIVLLRDFLNYWNHRLLHLPGFWPIHAVHHSDTDLNLTTAYRIHALEGVMIRLSYIPVTILVGFPIVSVLIAQIILTIYHAFVHIDADIHFGRFTGILASPRFHHWHHADTPDAYNTNFAGVFSIWDVLFGTYRVPGPYTGAYGFEETPGHSLPILLIWPFKTWLKTSKKPATEVIAPSSPSPSSTPLP